MSVLDKTLFYGTNNGIGFDGVDKVMKRPAHNGAVAKGIAVSRGEQVQARVSFYILTSGALLFALLLLGSGRLIGP